MNGILQACLCGVLLLAISASEAQRFSFRNVSKGLGNLTVNCIAQDSSGFLWMGTENGLYRYDGIQFRLYSLEEGLSARAIHSLYTSPAGTLWVGTNAGVFFQRQNGKFSLVDPPASFSTFYSRMGSVFTALSEDQILYTDTNGTFLLYRLEPDVWSAKPMHLEGSTVWSVLAAPNGVQAQPVE